MKPIEVTLYDPGTNEVVKTFTRSFVPWELLKRALRISKTLDAADMKEEDIDELASLVVATFGDQFTLEQASKGIDIGEMATVIMEIIGRASQFMGKNVDPTKAAR